MCVGVWGRGGKGVTDIIYDCVNCCVMFYTNLFLIFSHFATQNKKERSFAKISWTVWKRMGLLSVSASSTAALKTGVTDPMAQVSAAITNTLL